MRNPLILSLTCGAILLAAGCNNQLANNESYPSYANETVPVFSKIDARAAGALIVLNKNEISAGQLAEQKAVNPAVRNYAALLVREHSNNLYATETLAQRAGIQPIYGPAAVGLKQKGHQLMSSLKRVNGPAFDKTYINDMIKGHTEALHLLDTLLTQVSNPVLRAHLEKTRQHVSYHLQQAELVKSKMM